MNIVAANHSKKLEFRVWSACLAVFCILAVSRLAAQQEPTTVEMKFRQANQAYSQGKYDEAAGGYEELIKIVGPSADLYYNLGCASLKAGRPGMAVLNLHRAERLAPRDKDIRDNLKFVEVLTKAKSQEEGGVEESFFVETIFRWVFLITDRELAFLQLIFLGLFALVATVLALGHGGRLRSTLITLTVTCLLLLATNSVLIGVHYYRDNYMREAVVIRPNSEARSGPGEENTRVLVLPEGTLIRMRESRGGWVLVSLPSGRSGWLKSEMLEEI